jgi:hypothetical protein
MSAVLVGIAGFSVIPVSTNLILGTPAGAVSPGTCGSVLLAGTSWLSGSGVDVMSNGSDEGSGTSCGGSAQNSANGITTGSKWQCTELVNRLYATKGWISSTWHGNGGESSPGAGDSMYGEAPSSLSKQPNGSISSVGPGDVVSINLFDAGSFVADGHVLIVNTSGSVTGGTIPLVSQNAGDGSNATVTSSANLSNGSLTIPKSGAWTYSVIGVVHAPGSATGNPHANGALIQTPDQKLYVVAGGAPLYVTSCAAIGGCSNVIPVLSLAGFASEPANGTELSDISGDVWIVAGGAPLKVTSCTAIGGCSGNVVVDPATVKAMPTAPANGTELSDISGDVWIVAGGAPLKVTSCTAIGGCSGNVVVDPATVKAMPTAPANGTLVEGLPSGHFWEFEYGGLVSTAPSSSAIQVDDASISSFHLDAPSAITSSSSAIFIAAAASTFTPTTTGFPTPAFTEAGALPKGVTFASGTLSGTPTVSGTFPITFTASNGIGTAASQSFTLTVLPMGVTTTSLPSGSVYSKSNKVTYSATLAAGGGNLPYKWSLVSGSALPPGLKLSSAGVISGKATKVGTYTFTVEVLDTKTKKTKTTPSTQNTATATLSITIE